MLLSRTSADPDTEPVRAVRAISATTPLGQRLHLVLSVNVLCANVTTTLAPQTSTAASTVASARIGVPGVPVIEVPGHRTP